MGSVATVVNMALSVLGSEARDEEVKAYIRDHYPEVPQGQIGLALRKIRFPQPKVRPVRFDDEQRDLFEG